MEKKKVGNVKSKKLFSMKWKLMIIFAVLTYIVGHTCISVTVKFARKAVMEKVQLELIEKAQDTAKIVDRSIKADLKYLETIARMRMIKDINIDYFEKAKRLKEEADFSGLLDLFICDTKGTSYLSDGEIFNVSNKKYYQQALSGTHFITEPYPDSLTGDLCITVAVPIFGDNKNVIGVLCADFNGFALNKYIEDIVVGKTGSAYIIDNGGTVIADIDPEFVTNRVNSIELSKTDPNYKSVAKFEKRAIESKESSFGYFDWKGSLCIASFAKIKYTNWTIIAFAVKEEFLDSIKKMRLTAILSGIIVYIIALITIFFISNRMIQPIKNISQALKNISQGDGDLTARLPIKGNDEVTEVSRSFNETIEKINHSITSVKHNTSDMIEIGQTLSSNMTETASSINQISANIEGVKGQILNQSAGVTETSATMEEIIRTVHQLNKSIENQASTVTQSSSAIEEMIANIASIAKMLENGKELAQNLNKKTIVAKDGSRSANIEVGKIGEKSADLLEATAIIQNIAAQTNLLAMNADLPL